MPIAGSDITIRDFTTLADYDACVALQDETWGHGFAERVPGAILRVAQKIGGVAAGGFGPDGRLLGFVFGMTGPRQGTLVHWSDMLAVHPDARGSGLAARLKHHQREAVRALGVPLMVWTADPLVARNAHFNINILGARPAEYVENMYGANTGSVLHGAMPTDRAVYHWPIDAADRTGTGTPAAGDEALPHVVHVDAEGTPHSSAARDVATLRIAIPHDLEAVQRADAARALAWRLTVREAFRHLGAGYRVTRFVRGIAGALPYYVIARD